MSHESAPKNHESSVALSSAEARKHHERLKSTVESAAEKSGDQSEAEQIALQEALREAPLAAEINNSEKAHKPHEDRAITKEAKLHSFSTTMHHVRSEMPRTQRTFSKVIHQPIIERSSELVGKTIARPSGILGATIGGFLGLLIVFGVAKQVGFALSGSELPILLAAGLLIGLFVEWCYKSVLSLIGSKRAR